MKVKIWAKFFSISENSDFKYYCDLWAVIFLKWFKSIIKKNLDKVKTGFIWNVCLIFILFILFTLN